MVIKVADFGLSVNTGTKEYYRITGDMGIKLPITWMAPESLANHVFSETSDVVRCSLFHDSNHYIDHVCIHGLFLFICMKWSYGVTCWEIFTGGQAPYAGTKPSSILSLLQEGERLESPKNSACSNDV